MKKSFARKSTLMVGIVAILISTFALQVSAYNYKFVQTYEKDWWNKRNPSFFEHLQNGDCTNYVSQIAAFSGMPSWIDVNSGLKPSAANILAGKKYRYVIDERTNYWYSLKTSAKIAGISYDYHIYSRTWSIVSDFNSFMKGKSSYVKTTYYKQSEKAAMLKAAVVGDIIALDTKHSIAISKKDSDTKLFYTQHDTDRSQEPIATFTNWAAENANKNYSFVLYHFK